MREGTKHKTGWKNRLAVGGWVRRKAGGMKGNVHGIPDIRMGRHQEAPRGGGGT